jgi:hypothetical protein
MEKLKREQNEKLESIKADLALVTRLRGSSEEKRAEAAAQVLTSCLRYLDFLRVVTSPIRFGGEPGDGGFRRHTDSLWTGSQDLQSEFEKSWILSETYLPHEAAELMEKIWKRRSEIWASQSTHFDLVAQGGRDPKIYAGGFGHELGPEMEHLRDEAKALFRPIAQLSGALLGVTPPNPALNPTGLRPAG